MWRQNVGGSMTLTYKDRACTPNAATTIAYSAVVTDDNDPPEKLAVLLTYSGPGKISGTIKMANRGTLFSGVIGPFAWETHGNAKGEIKIQIQATDSGRKTTTLPGAPITLIGCPLVE